MVHGPARERPGRGSTTNDSGGSDAYVLEHGMLGWSNPEAFDHHDMTPYGGGPEIWIDEGRIVTTDGSTVFLHQRGATSWDLAETLPLMPSPGSALGVEALALHSSTLATGGFDGVRILMEDAAG